MPRQLVWLLMACLVFVPLRSASAQAPGETEIARLIKQLGHDDFNKREAATKDLAEIGEPLKAAEDNAAEAITKLGGTVTPDGKAEKRTSKRLAWFLIDSTTKGLSEPTETKGTGIKQIEIAEGTVGKKALPEAKDANGNGISEYLGDLTARDWVVKSIKMTLADDTVVEAEILLGKETGKATLLNVKKAGPGVVSDKGTRTWNAFYAEYQVATDASQEDIAQAEKDMEALQGTWREFKMTTVVVKGDRLSQIDFSAGPRDVITGLITIDAKTKAIDWPMETGLGLGVTCRGIYELKGDNLRIIFGAVRPGVTARPETFDEKDGWLLVLKREKP